MSNPSKLQNLRKSLKAYCVKSRLFCGFFFILSISGGLGSDRHDAHF
jgi:hypothetical protein